MKRISALFCAVLLLFSSGLGEGLEALSDAGKTFGIAVTGPTLTEQTISVALYGSEQEAKGTGKIQPQKVKKQSASPKDNVSLNTAQTAAAAEPESAAQTASSDISLTISGPMPSGAYAVGWPMNPETGDFYELVGGYGVAVMKQDGTIYEKSDELTLNVQASGQNLYVMNTATGTKTKASGSVEMPLENGEASLAVVRKITKDIQAGGQTYRVTVTLDEEDRIPADAELRVAETEGDPSAFHLSEEQTLVYSRFFDISIWHNGTELEPGSPVDVTIELLDTDISAFQVVHLDDQSGSAETLPAEGNSGSVTFSTDHFSVFGFGGIFSKITDWLTDWLSITVLAENKEDAPEFTSGDLPLERGLEILESYRASRRKSFALNLKRLTEIALGRLESVALYSIRDGVLSEVVMNSLDAVISLLDVDGFALVKDTGLREKTEENPLTSEGAPLSVTGMLPKEGELAVTALSGEEALGLAPAGEDEAVTKDDVLAAYDISIYADGEEWQPAAEEPVKVRLNCPEVTGAQNAGYAVEVWHILDDGTRQKVNFTQEGEDLVFLAEGFSVYMVVETVLETTIDIEGQTYKVTATYDSHANLPADAKLDVSEISLEDADYLTYLNSTAKALGVEAGELGYLRLLNISIVGEDGTAYKPNDQVKVTVELMNESETGDLRVVHFGEEAEELTATTSGDTVSFQTDSFSLFSFVDLTLIQNVVDAVFGSTYTDKIYENDEIIVSGKMPRTAIVEVNPAAVEIDGAEVLAAYDIKIYAGLITKALGIAWQPTDGALTVRMKSDAIKAVSADVYHMADAGGAAELIAEDVTVEGNTVVFEAEQFSVYVVVDHEGGKVVTPRVEFHFIAPLSGEAETGSLAGAVYEYTSEPYSFLNKNNEQQHTQILKDGEGLELIQNPANKTNPDSYFFGWYVVNCADSDGSSITYSWTEDPVQIPFETAISITPSTGIAIGDTVNWTMGSASGEGAVDRDGNVHVYLAPIYEDYYFANFHLGPKEDVGTDDEPGLARSLMTRRLIVLGSDGHADIRIGNIQAESPDAVHKIFVGWETVTSDGGALVTDEEYITLDSTGNEIDNPAGKTGYYITVNKEENIDLYPVFAEARWLYYNTGKAGNGATYVGAQYLLTSDDADYSTYYLDSLPISSRNGFEFKGWYLAKDGDENGTGVCITDPDTINTANKTVGLVDGYTKYAEDDTTKLWEIIGGKLYFYKAMDDLTLFAKWEEIADTTYSVIVWKQKVTDAVGLEPEAKSYDYVAADSQMNIPGISGQTLQDLINANALSPFITAGSNAKYTGFSYARATMTTDTVAGDKSTVVNVYYDRDVHTLRFQVYDYVYTISNNDNDNNPTKYGDIEGQKARIYWRNGAFRTSDRNNATVYTGVVYTRSSSRSWHDVYTITALYEQDITEYFPITGNNGKSYAGYYWYTADYTYTWLMIMPQMPAGDYTFLSNELGDTRVILYYKEVLPGETGETTFRDTLSGEIKEFSLYTFVEHRYTPLTFNEDFFPIEGFINNRYNAAPTTYNQPFGSGVTNYQAALGDGGTFNGKTYDNINMMYYIRKRSSLTFDVNYPNIAGLDYPDGTSDTLTVSDIPYGQPLAQYGQTDGEWYFGTGDNPTNRLYGPANYIFEGWYEDPAGTVKFNFDQTMPSGDKIVYAKWTPVTFRININPNGAVIDHSDHSAWDSGTQHYSDKSTYINASYGTPITEYTLTREYVPISDAVASGMNADEVYYYVYTPYMSNAGEWGLHPDLRNAIYLKESQLQAYYNYYKQVSEANIGYYPVTVLGYNAWKNDYVSSQKYRRAYSNESYVFLGWFKNDEAMPYNFADPVTESFTLTAHWRLDGGYYVQYIPEFRTENGVVINGDMARWRDPVSGATYADQAMTTTMQQPTGLTENGNPVEEGTYIFLGWRVVDVKETVDGQGNITSVTYTPVEKDGNGQVIYHREGEDFLIEAKYADASGRICLQAVYEAKDASVRRPEIANLTLDANTGFITTDGETELNASTNLETVGDVGTVLLDVDEGREQIIFGDVQSNIAVHLDQYAVSPNYFKHPEGFFLLGFDKQQDALAITKLDPQTGADSGAAQPYIPNYPADSVIAVQRTDSETLYAIWEPMVYLTVENKTGVGPVTFSLEDSNNGALYVVNMKDGLYDRTPLSSLGGITLEDYEKIDLAIPQGMEKQITIKGTNTLGTGKVLVWNTSLELVTNGSAETYNTASASNPAYSYEHTTDTAHSHELAAGETNNTKAFSFNETLIINEKPLVVTFTSRDNAYALLLDDNYPAASGLTGHVSERDYSSDQVLTNADPAGAKTDEVPSANTCLGYTFKGWAYTADATEPVYKPGNWIISNLEEFFEVGQTQAYTEIEGETVVRTLYAVWEVNQENNTVYVYKDVPEPGNQTQDFIFDIGISAIYNNSSNVSASGTFTLKHNQYAALYTGQDATRSPVNITMKVKIYNVADDTRVDSSKGDEPDYTFTASRTITNGNQLNKTFSDISISVTERAAANYTTTMKRLAQQEGDITLDGEIISTGTELLTVEGNRISWTRIDQMGTVVYTNTRQTADVTVKKKLAGEATGSFRYTGSYTADGKTTELEPFHVDAGSTATIEKIPVGAVLTLTEALPEETKDNYIVETEFLHGSADTNTEDKAVTFTVPEDGETVTFTNTLKSFPVKIIKLDQTGEDKTGIGEGVEARFNLTKGTATILSGKDTTPSSNVIYDSALHVGEYTLTETWVQPGYIGLTQPVTLTLTGTGELTSDSQDVVITGDADTGFLVKVYNVETVRVTLTKVLDDPLTGRMFSFTASYSATIVSTGKTITGTPTLANLAGGGTQTFEIPAGAVLTVTEQDTYDAYTIYDTTAEMTDKDGTVIENTADDKQHSFTGTVIKSGTLTFTNTRKEVKVTVEKTVQGDGRDFEFTATVKNGANVLSQYGTAETPRNGFAAGVQSFTLSPADNETDSTELTVPYGAVITLEETPVDGYTTMVGDAETTSYTSEALTEDTTVQFLNIQGAKLTVHKTVTGEMGDRTRKFSFTARIPDAAEGDTVNVFVGGVKDPEKSLTVSADGTVNFELAHDESIVLGLPLGKAIQISEINGDYTTTWTFNGGTASAGSGTSVTLTEDAALEVENNLPAVAPTGVSLRILPFLILLGVGALLMPMAFRRKRRKEE